MDLLANSWPAALDKAEGLAVNTGILPSPYETMLTEVSVLLFFYILMLSIFSIVF